MAINIIRDKVNLGAERVPKALQGMLFATERDAHKFIIEARRDGEKVTLSGTVTGKFIKPNQETVALDGAIEDGCVCVTLAQSCYTETGRFTLTIFVAEGDSTTALYCLTGNVKQTTTGTIIDPGNVVPDISEIRAEYANMQEAVEECEEAAASAAGAVGYIAKPFDAATGYHVGDYVIRNGKLYRRIGRSTAAAAWNSSLWAEVTDGLAGGVVGNTRKIQDVTMSARKMDAGEILDGMTPTAGYINSSGGISLDETGYTERLSKYYDYVRVEANDLINVYVKMPGDVWIGIGFYDGDYTFISRPDPVSGSTVNGQDGDYKIRSCVYKAPANAKYMRFSSRTYGDLTKSVTFDGGFSEDIDALNERMNDMHNLWVGQTAVQGLLNSSGAVGAQWNCNEYATDYIAVSAGEKVTLQTWVESRTMPNGTSYPMQMIVCRYDSEKAYLGQNTYSSASGDTSTYLAQTVTIPTGAAYIRVSSRMLVGGRVMINKGTAHEPYSPSVEDVRAAAELAKSGDALAGVNLYIAHDSVPGTVNTSNGGIDTAQANSYYYRASDYIPVTPYEMITAQVWTSETKNNQINVGFYDASKSFLSGKFKAAASSVYASFTMQVPAGAAYMRVSANWLSNVGKLMVTRGELARPYALAVEDIQYEDATIKDTLSRTGAYGMMNPFMRPMELRVVMHRGFSAQAPENTLPAFELAGQGEAWAIETDVWETTDGRFILSHDDDVSRMTDGTGKISEMTYAQTQECTIDAGSNIDQYPGLKMPVLEDYLKICRKYGSIAFVEIKGIVHYDNFIELIKSYGMEGSTVLHSYYSESMFDTLRALTLMPLAILATGSFSQQLLYAQRYTDIWLSLAAGSSYPNLITEANLKLAHAANVPVGGWTYTTKQGIKDAYALGVDFMITDNFAKVDVRE